MKLIIVLVLLWATTFSRAALFDFTSGAPAPSAGGQSSAWAVDLATARQWYIVWAASADRIYQRMINPGANSATSASHQANLNALLSQGMFATVWVLFAAALISIVRSISKVVWMSRRQLAPVAR